jgi:hypothetical protein
MVIHRLDLRQKLRKGKDIKLTKRENKPAFLTKLKIFSFS